jgi:hypothetical protein
VPLLGPVAAAVVELPRVQVELVGVVLGLTV